MGPNGGGGGGVFCPSGEFYPWEIQVTLSSLCVKRCEVFCVNCVICFRPVSCFWRTAVLSSATTSASLSLKGPQLCIFAVCAPCSSAASLTLPRSSSRHFLTTMGAIQVRERERERETEFCETRGWGREWLTDWILWCKDEGFDMRECSIQSLHIAQAHQVWCCCLWAEKNQQGLDGTERANVSSVQHPP